ncbi:hypothetical protein GQX74_006013 [Glossina fuscipes]|nr:hypothetical protein GQX74_006013 [Glossina fuscipes]
MKENGVYLTLTVVDTPSFGDSEYVGSKYQEYLTAESQVYRKQLPDNQVYCCLRYRRRLQNKSKNLRGRRYPWVLVEVENLTYCDFIALRNMIIRTHIQGLKDVTNTTHYENYRCRKLFAAGVARFVYL